jgi:hypothetical protein
MIVSAAPLRGWRRLSAGGDHRGALRDRRVSVALGASPTPPSAVRAALKLATPQFVDDLSARAGLIALG